MVLDRVLMRLLLRREGFAFAFGSWEEGRVQLTVEGGGRLLRRRRVATGVERGPPLRLLGGVKEDIVGVADKKQGFCWVFFFFPCFPNLEIM